MTFISDEEFNKISGETVLVGRGKQEVDKKPGLIQSMAQDVAKPFLKTAVTGYLGLTGIKNLAMAGKSKIFGDEEGYKKYVQKITEPKVADFGYLGKVEPTKSFRESIGTGIELGSWAIGGGGVRKVTQEGLKQTLLQAGKTGAKYGAVGTGMYAGGREVQEEETTVRKVAEETIGGGLIGAGTGGVLSPIGVVAGRGVKGILNHFRKGSKEIEIVAKTNAPKILKTPVAKTAMRTGVDIRDVDIIQNASKEDKLAFLKMFKLAEKSEKTRRITERPVSISGKTILDRVKYIQDIRRSAGKEIGKTIKEMPSDVINITNVYDDFVNKISGAGIRVKKNGMLDFRGSRLAGKMGAPSRKLLQQVANDVRPNKIGEVLRTPQRINTVRQQLFDDLKIGKRQMVVGDYADNILNSVRDDLKKPLVEISPKYKDLTIKYAESTTAIQDFYNLLGKKWSGKSDEVLALRSGEVGNRILGNASAVPLEVLNRMEKIAIKNGYKSKNNVIDQLLFSDFLEDLFGTAQTRSLRGQVGRGAKDVAGVISTGADVARGDIIKLAGKAIGTIKGITPEKQKKAVLELLKEGIYPRIGGKSGKIGGQTGKAVSKVKSKKKIAPEAKIKNITKLPIKNLYTDIKGGGITYNIPKAKNMAGEKAFAVSVFPNRASKPIESSGFSKKDVAKFIEKNFDLLSDEKFNMGGWVDEGKVYLDISKLFTDKKKALRAGKEFNQLAITDLYKIVHDFKNAFVDTGGTGEIVKISDKKIFGILKKIGD